MEYSIWNIQNNIPDSEYSKWNIQNNIPNIPDSEYSKWNIPNGIFRIIFQIRNIQDGIFQMEYSE